MIPDEMTGAGMVISGYNEGERQAGQDYKDVGAFDNPFDKGTYQYNGYAYAESKHFREDISHDPY